MRDRRSTLETVNDGRKRRAHRALDELDYTLDRLEGRLGGQLSEQALRVEGREEGRVEGREEDLDRQPRYVAPRHESFRDRLQPAFGHAAPAYDEIANEMRELRDELRQQMSAGLHHEFAALRNEIERALKNTAPTRPAAGLNAEFERLSSIMHRLSEESDDRQAHLLQREREDLKKSLDLLAREDTMRSSDHRWGEFDHRFSEMAGRLAAPRPAAVDPLLNRLATRIEEIGTVVSALPTSGALRSLEDKMQVLQGAVERFSRQQEQAGTGLAGAGVLDNIEERLNELSRAVAVSASLPRAAAFDPAPFERLEARISSLARQLGEATQEDATSDLSGQLAALAHRVEDLAHRIELPQHAIERLAGQIGTIADRLDHAPALPNLDAVFHGLESRIAAMAGLLEQRHEDALAHGKALFRDLETRIDDVAMRLDNEPSAPGTDAQFIAAMDARFADLAAHFERQAAAASAATRDDDDALRNLEDQLERRLDTISSRIESSSSAVDTDLIRSLEAQIAGLAEHISRPNIPPQDGNELMPRLERIEQSLAGSKQDVIEAARHAAEAAVRNFSGDGQESELVTGLADDLKSLETLMRRSDDRNARTFEAIHDTLLKIVDRLGALENEETRLAAAGMPDLTPEQASAPAPAPMPVREMVLETAQTPSLAPDDDMLAPASAAMSLSEISRGTLPGTLSDEATSVKVQSPSGRSSLLGGLARKLSRGSKIGKSGKAAGKSAGNEGSAETLAEMAETAGDKVKTGEAPLVELDAPLDPQLANQPLEPGSGAPDLNAIMRRVRDERGQAARGTDIGAAKETSRADFIAAARRAAQAAAVEAESMKRGSGKDKNKDKEEAGSGSIFKRRRKPLLMGVAAILIALAALQGSRMFLSVNSAAQRAEIPAPAAVAALPVEDEAGETQPVQAETQVSSVATDDWLDMETSVDADVMPDIDASIETASTGAETVPFEPVSEVIESEVLPEPDEETLAAIPLDAGPVALREAAAAGDAKALFEIGNRYAEGRGVAEDMTKAVIWYEKAAQQGLAPAQYRLGSFYEKGIGVARDIDAARHWYELAAQSGNASAMHNLAVLHAMGTDGRTDNNAAARWFQRAADFGVRDSQFNLGILAARGVGMEQNLQEAYKWFALVAKAGDKDAAGKRDEVARALRPEQLDTARAAADLWRAKELDAEANMVDVHESWSESQATTASVDMHAAVRNIQKILNANGYEAGAEDGLMGQKTKMAIAAFQKDHGMETTGEVDEALVRALLEKR